MSATLSANTSPVRYRGKAAAVLRSGVVMLRPIKDTLPNDQTETVSKCGGFGKCPSSSKSVPLVVNRAVVVLFGCSPGVVEEYWRRRSESDSQVPLALNPNGLGVSNPVEEFTELAIGIRVSAM